MSADVIAALTLLLVLLLTAAVIAFPSILECVANALGRAAPKTNEHAGSDRVVDGQD